MNAWLAILEGGLMTPRITRSTIKFGARTDQHYELYIRSRRLGQEAQRPTTTPKDEKNWQITYDEAGTPYYYNDKGETTYEKPDGFVDEETAEYQSGGASDYYEASAGYDDWTEAYDDDGNVYYFNSAGESTYEYPW